MQFIAQGVGFMLAGQLDIVSPMQLLCFQMLVFLLSSWFIKRSHPVMQAVDKSPLLQSAQKRPLIELREGLVLFRNDKSLQHLIVIVFATGFLALVSIWWVASDN